MAGVMWCSYVIGGKNTITDIDIKWAIPYSESTQERRLVGLAD